MKIYVASSWRNTFQPEVVTTLRADGHDVYDFKDADGFSWSEVDPGWQSWPDDVSKYFGGMKHPSAERGFNRDMTALREADACVMVMPCGMSASLETGYAIGAGKPTAVFVPAMREPDLMVKMAHLVTGDLGDIRRWLAELDLTPVRRDSFQGRVDPWLLSCFGHAIARNHVERNHRFLEEALEVVQSAGCTKHEAEQLVAYVFGRPSGELKQEIGGALVTLAALCLAVDVDMESAGDSELRRCWQFVEKIRAKQAAKPKHSPLPTAEAK